MDTALPFQAITQTLSTRCSTTLCSGVDRRRPGFFRRLTPAFPISLTTRLRRVPLWVRVDGGSGDSISPPWSLVLDGSREQGLVFCSDHSADDELHLQDASSLQPSSAHRSQHG